MRTYTFDELVERYELSKAGFSKFFHANEEKLVKDGQKHYRQEGKRVFFDEVAVEIMDDLRGLNRDIISAKEESANEIRVRELLEENNTLKTQMLLLQQKRIEDKETINQLTKETVEVKLLAERNNSLQEKIDTLTEANTVTAGQAEQARVELATAMAELDRQAAELERQQAEIDRQRQQLAQQTEQLQQSKAENTQLQNDLKAERSKSFWQKLFG